MRKASYLPDQPWGNQAFEIAPVAAENARFMSRVYGWMTAGLSLTGAVAWNVAGNPQLVQAVLGNRLLFWEPDHRTTWEPSFCSPASSTGSSGLTATLIYFSTTLD